MQFNNGTWPFTNLRTQILLHFNIECVENVVLLLAVTVCLQGLRVHKSNILHGVTNIFNIYSNICNIDSYFVYKLSIK
jgi:hypothetical protein